MRRGIGYGSISPRGYCILVAQGPKTTPLSRARPRADLATDPARATTEPCGIWLTSSRWRTTRTSPTFVSPCGFAASVRRRDHTETTPQRRSSVEKSQEPLGRDLVRRHHVAVHVERHRRPRVTGTASRKRREEKAKRERVAREAEAFALKHRLSPERVFQQRPQLTLSAGFSLRPGRTPKIERDGLTMCSRRFGGRRQRSFQLHTVRASPHSRPASFARAAQSSTFTELVLVWEAISPCRTNMGARTVAGFP